MERRGFFFFNVGDGVLTIEVLFDFKEGGGVPDRGLLIDPLSAGLLSADFVSSELFGFEEIF